MLLSMFGRDAWESVHIAVRKTANYEVPMISAVRQTAKCEVPMISAGNKNAYHTGYLEMTVWFLKNKTNVSIDVSL